MGLKKHVSIRQALQYVANNPDLEDDDLISKPVHELVARTLFEHANTGHPSRRGSMARANVARKMIFDRMVGRKRPGSHPNADAPVEVEIEDLTGGGEIRA
jgi:hypothetical protein